MLPLLSVGRPLGESLELIPFPLPPPVSPRQRPDLGRREPYSVGNVDRVDCAQLVGRAGVECREEAAKAPSDPHRSRPASPAMRSRTRGKPAI